MAEASISMSFAKNGRVFKPIKTFRVNGSIIIAIYKGTLSPLDILIKYRQKQEDGEWSHIRTPKHIHWTVDILMKMQSYERLTREFIDCFINIWEQTRPLKNEKERRTLDLGAMMNLSSREIRRFEKLSRKGEYSVKFLILLARLLMLQEKTNRADAYMFKSVLHGLREGKDLFRILSAASYRGS